MIRCATAEDAQALCEIYAYYVENTAITFEYDVPTVESFRDRINHTLEKYPYLVLLENNVIKGYAYAGAFVGRAAYDWSAEVTVYVDRDAKKKGYGRMLYDALEEELTQMGILNLYACIAYPSNDSKDPYLTKNSAEFHAHLGFEKVGHFHRCGYKFDRWYDMIWMEKIIGEHTMEPQNIR